ncbi:hypothetical protein PybrP1_009156 [[Pythium] brassicae (nom. inval.)]|nr:hypothetical protein PybrP1_009156 [[Pythium] brassicae (nom. inval.)]
MTDFGLVVVKALASLFSLAMILSPALQIQRVHAERRTGEMAIMPLAGLLLSCHMWMVYGLITGDIFPLFVTYLIGVVASVVYIGVYYRYTAEKAYARRVVLAAAALVAVISLYTILGKAGATGQSSHDVDQVVGYVTVCGSVALYTSPFETIARVLKTKSAASIPALMCACGCVSNSLWILYGLLQHDAFVWGLGVFCTAFALLQVVLYCVFHPTTDAASAPPEHALDDAEKRELSIAVESPCFAAMKSPLAPLQ